MPWSGAENDEILEGDTITLPSGEEATVTGTSRQEPRFGDQQVSEGVYVRPPWQDVVAASPITQGGAMDAQWRPPAQDMAQPGETGRSWDEANQTLTITRDNPGMLEDTARGAWEGLQRGFEGIRNLPDAAGDFVARLDRERTEGFGSDPTLDPNDRNLMQQVGDAIRPEDREHYRPTSMPGRVAEKVMEYAPGAVFGPEAAIASLTGGTADAGTREVVRAAGGDQQAQDVAGTVAGVAGGFLRPRLPSPGQAPVVANTPSGGFTVSRPVPPQAPARPGSMADIVADFEGAGVDPSLAVVNRQAAGAAKLVSENALAGGRVRAQATTQLDQASAEAQRIAGEYGAVRAPVNVGEDVSRGAQRFANDPTAPDSFAARSKERYDRAFNGDGTPQYPGIPNAPVVTPQTDIVLGEIVNRVGAPRMAELITNPRVKKIVEAMADSQGVTSFDDLRALRSWVREQRTTPNLGGDGIDPGQLKRIEGALTADILSEAGRLGGPRAAAALQRADQAYARGQARIERALQPLQGKPGESVYNRLISMAGSKASADIRALASIKRSLRPEEWNDLSATVISNMGNPTAGAVGAVNPEAFSINTFVTNYNNLSPQGRAVLFGSTAGGSQRTTQLAGELDRLARVADRLKMVESQANMSRSGVNAQNLLSGGGLLNPGTFLPTAKLLTVMAAGGEALSNPAVVRWMVRIGEARTPQALNARILALKAEGAQSPALMALAQRIEAYRAEQDQQAQPVQ